MSTSEVPNVRIELPNIMLLMPRRAMRAFLGAEGKELRDALLAFDAFIEPVDPVPEK